VVYVVDADGQLAIVQAWIGAEHLSPARTGRTL